MRPKQLYRVVVCAGEQAFLGVLCWSHLQEAHAKMRDGDVSMIRSRVYDGPALCSSCQRPR